MRQMLHRLLRASQLFDELMRGYPLLGRGEEIDGEPALVIG